MKFIIYFITLLCFSGLLARPHKYEDDGVEFDETVLNNYFKSYEEGVNGIDGRNPMYETRDDYLERLKKTNSYYLEQKYQSADTNDAYPEELKQEKEELDEITKEA